MQYVLLNDKYGGLNTYLSPDKVGPGGAVEMFGVDISDGELKNRIGDEQPLLDVNNVFTYTDTYIPATSKTIVPWKTGAIGMTGRYSVARFGDRLYRSHKGFSGFPADLNSIQYTSDTSTPPTWDILGLFNSATPTFSVASAGSGSNVPAGTYVYYCTFYNAAGHESPPISSSQLVLSSNTNVTVTLPKGYTTATFSNGSTSITVVDRTSLRTGMRIAGAGIQSGTYITNIVDTTPPAATVTISKTTSAGNVANNYIYDAQISGIKIYRQNINTMTQPLLVKTVTGLSNTTTTDDVVPTSLGLPLETLNNSNMITGLRDVCISPSGTLMCVGPSSTLYYFSVVDPGLFDATKFIKVADAPMAMIYALDRFICPTLRGAFTVTIDDAILGIPIIQIIDDTEPCQVSYNTYVTDVGGAVWWNTNKGIVQTDGNTIETVTKFTFAKPTVSKFVDCYGAEYYNNDYVAYLADESGYSTLYKFNRQTGWTILNNYIDKDSGTIGFHINLGCSIYTGKKVSGSNSVYLLEYYQTTRQSSGFYKTGDWTGDKTSSLKKFRKVSVLFYGYIKVTPYVDGVQVGSQIVLSNSTMTRNSFWLPSGTKGRTFAIKISDIGQDTIVQELGVWVGEQREPMP